MTMIASRAGACRRLVSRGPSNALARQSQCLVSSHSARKFSSTAEHKTNNNHSINNTQQQQELPTAWNKVAVAATPQEMQQAYADWSENYDEDSIERYGYVAPRRGAEEFHRQLSAFGFSQNARLADIGAGTGLVGMHLHSLGYQNLSALDFSQAMLQQAAKKQAYGDNLIRIDLNWDLQEILATTGLTVASFDGAISVGTFTQNHVGVKALLNVIALVKPGGLLTISMREIFYNQLENGIQYKLKELEQEGILGFVHVTEPELYTPKVSDTIRFQVWSWRILRQQSVT